MRRRGHAHARARSFFTLLALSFVSVLLGARAASAQQLTLQLASDEVYANLPFELQVIARGFDENPQPTLSKLAIAGCKVTPLGVAPQVSSMVQIINGQRSESRDVTYAFRFRIEADRAGQFLVPALTAEQGGKKAQSQPARFTVRAVDDSGDMQLRLVLPERPLWVGETVDGALEWYLRRDVGNRAFSVPLFDEEQRFEIEAPAGEPRLGGFRAGGRPLELPYEQAKATLDGTAYSRFRFLFRLTPTSPGTLSPPPPRVVAELSVGVGRDMFGFPVPQSRLFQAVAKPLRIEVRPLPLAGRPASFKNAVGRAFAMEVQAGRTVVRVGDPIELRVLLRGRGRLPGLILPELSAMGLDAQHFSAPEEPPSGEVLEDGKGKLFRVSVRLRSTEVREIPALSFSYFDPDQGRYETVRSQPIALSVKGSSVVSAGDVVGPPGDGAGAQGAQGSQGTPGAKPGAKTEAAPLLSLVGAELALSDENLTLEPAPSLRRVMPLLIGLYGAALLLLVAHAVRVRKQAAWLHDAAVQRCLRQLRKDLDEATTGAARDSAPRLCAALRGLRKELGLPGDAGKALLDRLETEAYSPGAVREPLAKELRDEVDALAQAWHKAGAAPRAGQSGAALALVIGALGLGSAIAAAQVQDAAVQQKLKAARAAYQAALAEPDRDRRRSGFAEAEAALCELARSYADRPQLHADCGSAALLSQEPGRAVLAYRRALELDPRIGRARRNLAFLRERLPDWLPRPRGGALESLLPLNQAMPRPHRHLALAVLVLAAVALLIPWSPRRRRVLASLAILPLLGGAVLVLSLLLERDSGRDAVVVLGGGTLRAADSSGAPPALARPLPAGAEVVVDEVRGDFTRVSLTDGQTGWLPAGTLEPLTPATATPRR